MTALQTAFNGWRSPLECAACCLGCAIHGDHSLGAARRQKNPFYHITVADRAAKRDGRFIERVGFFNPLARGQEESLRVDLARVDHWLSVGAQPSDRVKSLIKQARSEAKESALAEEAPAAEGPAAVEA